MDKAPVEMHDRVGPKPTHSSLDDDEVGVAYHDSLKGHTRDDQANMSRMGKVQELRVC